MTLEQLKDMRERVQHLHRFLRVADRQQKIESDRQLSLSEGFWNDNT
ncbi:MAG: peptide chain release factor 2, partial [Chitinophagaceae bacterium]|nr:peptide chain release factor 2 [Chitinophagaceae bacterium]